MSEERNYPVAVIQEALRQHLENARAVAGEGWIVDVLTLLIKEAAVVPPPVERADTIPDYIYRH